MARGEMRPVGGVGILLVGMGGALVGHVLVNGKATEAPSQVLLGLSLAAFGISMIRSDRNRT